MKLNDYFTTKELKKYITNIYKKIECVAKQDGTYQALSTRFENANPEYCDGKYCFSDEKGYHYLCLERGTITVDKSTKNIQVITYWVVSSQIFWMSYEYERKHRISGQDNRRLMFSKRLQYFSILGDTYARKAENEINEILKKAPFQDELFN